VNYAVMATCAAERIVRTLESVLYHAELTEVAALRKEVPCFVDEKAALLLDIARRSDAKVMTRTGIAQNLVNGVMTFDTSVEIIVIVAGRAYDVNAAILLCVEVADTTHHDEQTLGAVWTAINVAIGVALDSDKLY